MTAIVYLDPDDEITSAAARIRRSEGARVALVIPFGSRVATSRINFRLLAREAMVNGRRLDIVAPDASARALAASAGLPVFGSVGEYEDAIAGAAAAGPAAPDMPGTDRHVEPPGRTRPGAAGTADRIRTGDQAGPLVAPEPVPPGPANAGRDPEHDPEHDREAELDAIMGRSRHIPVARPPLRLPGAGLVAGVLVLLTGLVAAAVAAVLFLPAAEISIAPRVEAVGPVELVVTADPSVSVVDRGQLLIPAETVTFPVQVSLEFPATGKRIESAPATGTVRWRNCDPSDSYTIPVETSVRTPDGISFTIDEAVFLPVAQIEGSGSVQTIRCQTSEVTVTAAKPGPEGNVDAGRIRVVPARYNRNLVTVTNPEPTAGGVREEFIRISRRDVDTALVQLRADLQAQFEIVAEDPPAIPSRAAVVPGTASLGEPAPSVDTESLIGMEVESFALGLTATATMLAVDTSPIDEIVAAALAEAVRPGWAIVEGSTRVAVGDATVGRGVIAFPAAGVAKQLQPVDGEALRGRVLGLPEDEARAILDPYGDVVITLWPDMVTGIPGFEQRVTLTVLEAVDRVPDVEPVLPSLQPAATPTRAPEGASPSQPVPSG